MATRTYTAEDVIKLETEVLNLGYSHPLLHRLATRSGIDIKFGMDLKAYYIVHLEVFIAYHNTGTTDMIGSYFSYNGETIQLKEPMLKDVIKNIESILKILGITETNPVFKAIKKAYVDIGGKMGQFLALNPQNMETDPTGKRKTSTSLVEAMLNKIHPDFTTNLENFCNCIRGLKSIYH